MTNNAKQQHADLLRRLGLSDAIAGLAEGHSVHREFQDYGLPFEWEGFSSVGAPGLPDCVLLAAFCGTDFVACQERNGGLEFIAFHVEDVVGDVPDYEVVAQSEQGLWFYLIWPIIESRDWHDEVAARKYLKEVSDAVGFKHLAKALDMYFSEEYDYEQARQFGHSLR